MMIELLNIPKHTKCTNCGECCGMIPVSDAELRKIKEYLSIHEKTREKAIQRSGKPLDCPFRDNTAKRCTIYEVRPILCRLMGVCKGMKCLQGNTTEIDGSSFVGLFDMNKTEILNFVKW